MQKVTVQWMAEKCFCSESNIKKLLSEEVLVGEKNEEGIWELDMDSSKNVAYLNLRKAKMGKKAQGGEEVAGEVAQISQVSQPQELLAILASREQRIEELAREAGERKQIEANLIEKNKDVEYWREKYFELQETNRTLAVENALLKEKMTQPFWRKWKIM